MGRDDLYISIPSFFRCPISLDVMKSPVSLSTGVTYDRSSIQRWLDGGNNTCPATMQVLQTKDLVPNHTLQRLIQIWSDSVNTCPPTTKLPSNLVTQAEAKSLIHQLRVFSTANPSSSIDVLSQTLSKLILFGKHSEDNCNFLAADSDLLRIILCMFTRYVQLTEKILQLMCLVLKSYNAKNDLIIPDGDQFVKSLMVNLVEGRTVWVKITAMKILKLLSDLRTEFKNLISENEGIYAGLLSLICDSKAGEEDIEHCLQCLISIATPKRNRVKLVRAGAVAVLATALHEGELNHVLTEMILKLVELMSTCKEGRREICGNEKCVEAILGKMLKVSTLATEYAVTTLWSLCCLFNDKRAQEAAGKSNGMAKILLLLQTSVSPAVRQMCNDLLKVFRVSSRGSCLSSYDTKTTHIMPF